MNLFLLFFLIIFWLWFITVRQSNQKKETVSFLDNLKKEIIRIKGHIAELENRTAVNSSAPVKEPQNEPQIKEKSGELHYPSTEPTQHTDSWPGIIQNIVPEKACGFPEAETEHFHFKSEDYNRNPLQVPVFSTVLPFMLLIFASVRIAIDNPAPIFVLGLLLTVTAIWLARYLDAAVIIPVTMGSSFLLELVLHLSNFNTGYAMVFLGF